MPAATEALSDATVPRCGIWNRPLQRRATASRIPFPSAPMTSATGPVSARPSSAGPAGAAAPGAGPGAEHGQAALAQVVDDPHQVVDLGDPDPLGGAGRGLDRAGGDRR